jgi:hypothetical protein
MSLEEYTREKLWPILIEMVHTSVMYPSRKAYTRDTILPEKADTTPTELAARLNMPLGEALVIIYELTEEQKSTA